MISSLDFRFIKAKSHKDETYEVRKDVQLRIDLKPSLLLLVSEKLAGTEAWQIVAIFSFMFMGITIAALWFAHSSSKVESKKELKKKKMEIIDKHFNEMMRIECPYCHTIYSPNELECPNCRANTKKILFPEIPE